MAKKQTRASKSAGARNPSAQAAPVQSKIGDFAEDLGRLLGSAERRATEWLDQRKTVATQLTAIRDKASALLSQLNRASVDLPGVRRKLREAGAVKSAEHGSQARKRTARKKRVVSAETRAKMAAAQKKRWAAKRSQS